MIIKLATIALLVSAVPAFAAVSKYKCVTFLYNQKGLQGSPSARLPNSDSQFELNVDDESQAGYTPAQQSINYNNGVAGTFGLFAQNLPMTDGSKKLQLTATFDLQNGQIGSASIIPKEGSIVAIKVSGDIWAEAVCDLVP